MAYLQYKRYKRNRTTGSLIIWLTTGSLITWLNTGSLDALHRLDDQNGQPPKSWITKKQTATPPRIAAGGALLANEEMDYEPWGQVK